MKKILVLCLVSLLFACASPDTVTLDISTGIPPVALLPDGGTDPDDGNGGTDKPETPVDPDKPTRPTLPDNDLPISITNLPNNDLPISITNRPDNDLPINITNRPDNSLPDPIRDPNDPWQNLQIGYYTPNAVGLKRYEEFATEDLRGFGFTEDISDKLEVMGFYYDNNLRDAKETYKTIRMANNYNHRELWYLESIGLGSNALIPNFESGRNSFKDSFYYERAEANDPSEKFRSNLPIGKVSMVVNYRLDKESKYFYYYFKGTNEGYGKLELVGYKIYANGEYLIEGDTYVETPYIKSDYDPR